MKCWNCGGKINAGSNYLVQAEPVCGYCAEDFAEKEGDICKVCDKSDFKWSDSLNDLICANCEREKAEL